MFTAIVLATAPSVAFHPTLSPLPPCKRRMGQVAPARRSNHRPVQYQAQGRAPLELSDEPSIGHVKGSSTRIAFALRILVHRFGTSSRNVYSPRPQEREP
ncbi:hypothetical protein BKA70DRAFT_1437438 [Coprinopsis sp. MPI-PUGE-AT-0042]|nr:hypothetical protein BKA70DRAFT_1437438 [Coprinopsis sp. MPI-PUGE-AT-0042]